MKNEIEIIEGHNSSSYFWIMPINVLNYEDTDDSNNVDEYRNLEISIEEEYVGAFLYPFLLEFYDKNLKEHNCRGGGEGNEFEWYLTYNYYTMDTIKKMINKIRNVSNLLKEDYYNDELDEYKNNYLKYIGYIVPKYDYNYKYSNDIELEIIKDNIYVVTNFYERFTNYLENMVNEGTEKGYKFISFMGP